MAAPEEKTLEGAYNFAQVLKDEGEEIARQCRARGVACDLEIDGPTEGRQPDRLGVAFSGGGIRSACVGMGILQRLARAGMLRQAHYISGISGGGYLVGWLTAWTKRSESLLLVEAQLGHNTSSGQKAEVAKPPKFDRFIEPSPIHYLRKYSSYLTPRVGLMSGDTLAMISVYLRNLFLNQLLLFSSMVSLILLLQLLAPSILWQQGFSKALIESCGGILLGAFAAGVTVTSLALHRIAEDQEPKERPWFSGVAIGCSLLACALLWLMLPSWYAEYPSGRPTALVVVVLVLAGFALTRLFATSAHRPTHGVLQPVTREGRVLPLLAAWGVFGGSAGLLDLAFRHWLIHISQRPADLPAFVHVSDAYVIFGLPALLLGLALQSYLFIGVLGTAFPDGQREWLARAAGYFLYFAGAIALVLAISLWGPVAMHLLFTGFGQSSWRGYIVKAVLPGGWLFIVLSGLAGANSAQSSGEEGKSSKLNVLIAVAPPVFLFGLLLLASWGTHALVRHTLPFGGAKTAQNREYLTMAAWKETPSTASAIQWDRSDKASLLRQENKSSASGPGSSRLHWLKTEIRLDDWKKSRRRDYLLLFLGSLMIAVLLGSRLDVNEFSLHLFYRNRLVRAFLGASQDPPGVRRPSPFTGFALGDDIPLADLTLEQTKFQGPYPIWGTTLNLTAGEDLAWQQRKGDSFIYSPLYCGWEYVDPKKMPAQPEWPAFDADAAVVADIEPGKASRKSENNMFGYRATGRKVASNAAGGKLDADAVVLSEGYGGPGGRPYIGTAMAASGAAVSPNSGYHTRPGVAALLAIFNLRLGWWTGNPRNTKTWKEYAPSITYLVRELLGQANDQAPYVYLSDGGHFENLGIYELVRRKVRLILCSDADGDPDFTFEDLGNAIDKCRRDFGVEIHLRAQRDIAAEGGKGFRSGHYAIGEIHYPGQKAKGCLLYIKSSLTNDEPSDVLGMKAQDAAFPHDTTANQFFNESMFESYRALGEHMLDIVFDHFKVNDDEPDKAAAVRKLFFALVKQGEEQKKSDAAPKPPPLEVIVTGAVPVQAGP